MTECYHLHTNEIIRIPKFKIYNSTLQKTEFISTIILVVTVSVTHQVCMP